MGEQLYCTKEKNKIAKLSPREMKSSMKKYKETVIGMNTTHTDKWTNKREMDFDPRVSHTGT